MKTLAVGRLFAVNKLGGDENNARYVFVVGHKNTYKETEGEYAGTYARTPVEGVFFADTPEKVKFVENTVKPLVAEKGAKEFNPVGMYIRYKNNNYGEGEDRQYNNEWIIEHFMPHL